MGLFSNFPYTDFENLNLDWMIRILRDYQKQLELLQNILDNKIDDYLLAYIEEHIDEFLLQAQYIEDNKTIKLMEVNPNE